MPSSLAEGEVRVKRFSELASRIEERPSSGVTRLIGVDGCGGAGKSMNPAAIYDWKRREHGEWHTLKAGGTVILEGVTATRREWRDQLAYGVWIECPRDLRLAEGYLRLS